MDRSHWQHAHYNIHHEWQIIAVMADKLLDDVDKKKERKYKIPTTPNPDTIASKGCQ